MLDVHEVRGSTPLSLTYSCITWESKHEIDNCENSNMTNFVQKVSRIHGKRNRLERPDMASSGRSEVRLLYRSHIHVLLGKVSMRLITVRIVI